MSHHRVKWWARGGLVLIDEMGICYSIWIFQHRIRTLNTHGTKFTTRSILPATQVANVGPRPRGCDCGKWSRTLQRSFSSHGRKIPSTLFLTFHSSYMPLRQKVSISNRKENQCPHYMSKYF